MLSGPITQEAGISEIQSGEKGGERNEGGWGGKEAGRRRQLWRGGGGERERIKMHEDKPGSNRAQNFK